MSKPCAPVPLFLTPREEIDFHLIIGWKRHRANKTPQALDWVKENIAALFKGKFNQAIAFSGGMTVSDVEMSAVQIAHYMAPLAVEDGKAADLDDAVSWPLFGSKVEADYLKDLSADRLASLIGDVGIHMALFPHLFTDGTVLPKEGFQTTKYNSVPFLMLPGSGQCHLSRWITGI